MKRQMTLNVFTSLWQKAKGLAFCLILLSFLAGSTGVYGKTVVINEIAPSNSLIADPAGETNDWIELYNTTSSAINLSGYYLSDSKSHLKKFMFPSGASIPANKYLIIWADGDTLQAGLHTSFKLSSSGESLYLSNASAQIIDEVTFGLGTGDMSYSRVPDGADTFVWQSFTHNKTNSGVVADIYTYDLNTDGIVINEYSPINSPLEKSYSGAVNIERGITFIEFNLKQGTTVLDNEKIPILKEGESTYCLDLTNENVKVPATTTGKVLADGLNTAVTNYVLFKGTLDITSKAVFTIVSSKGVTANLDTNNKSITISSLDSIVSIGTVTLTAKNTTGTFTYGTKVFTITKEKNGTNSIIYSILPSTNFVSRDNNGIPNIASITCDQMKRTGSANAIKTSEKAIYYTDYLTDQDGESDDWIELYNNSSSSINLLGYYLSDKTSNPRLWAFPDTSIAPGGYIIVWADNDDDIGQAGLHAHFQLSGLGETLLLTNQTTVIGRTSYEIAFSNKSYARIPNGKGEYAIQAPSFSSSNGGNFTENLTTAGVVINEIVPVNLTVKADQEGGYDDFIELFNNSSSAVNLSNYYLSDDAANPSKWPFPYGTTIAAGGYFIVWADEDPEGFNDNNKAHASFRLAAEGETILLTDGTKIIDKVTYNKAVPDSGYARITNGTGTNFYWQTATYKKTNGTTIPVSEEIITEVPEQEFVVAHNRNNQLLTVTLANDESKKITVYSITAAVQYSGIINGSISIPTSDWKNGVYLISIGNKEKVKKVVILK